MTLTYEELVPALLERFPQLTSEYRKVAELFEPDLPGGEIVIGDVFTPYLRALIASRRSEPELSLALAFLNEMSGSADEQVAGIAAVSVLEELEDYPNLLKRVKPKLGSASRAQLPTRDWAAEQGARRADRPSHRDDW